MAVDIGAQRVIEDLRLALYRRRITIAALASTLGRSYSQVSRRFNGEVPLNVGDLHDYAAAAGLTVEIRLQDSGAPAATSPSADAPVSTTEDA